MKGIVLIASLEFYLFSIIDFLTTSLISFDSLPASLEAILIISFSTFYLFEQVNKPVVTFVYQQPAFWIIAGFIMYLSGNLFLFIQASRLDTEILNNFWKINLVLTIIKNIFFAIAFTFKERTVRDHIIENYRNSLQYMN